jgi:acyl carrier protein
MKKPVRTIDLGVVEGAGYTAENVTAAAHAVKQGVRSFRIEEVFALLSHAIAYPIAPSPAASQVLIGTRRADPYSGTEEAASQRADQRFAHIWPRQSHESGAQVTAAGEQDVRLMLRSSSEASEAVSAVIRAIAAKLSRLLAMTTDEIRPDRSVASYGADSLIAVELRNWVSKHLEAHVQIFELMSGLTIQELSRQVAERSRLVPASVWTVKE